jgi:hypothetical protein
MRAVALALVAAAAVAGCGGSSGEAPRALPSVSPSPVAVASPTPTGKDAPTPEGAAEFVRYFYGQIEHAFAAKDPQAVASLSLPGCVSCQNYIRSLTRLRDRNERVVGFHIKIVDAVAPAIENAKLARVDVFWNYGGAVRYDASGKVLVQERPRSGIEEQVNLSRVGASWRVAEIARMRDGQ